MNETEDQYFDGPMEDQGYEDEEATNKANALVL